MFVYQTKEESTMNICEAQPCWEPSEVGYQGYRLCWRHALLCVSLSYWSGHYDRPLTEFMRGVQQVVPETA